MEGPPAVLIGMPPSGPISFSIPVSRLCVDATAVEEMPSFDPLSMLGPRSMEFVILFYFLRVGLAPCFLLLSLSGHEVSSL